MNLFVKVSVPFFCSFGYQGYGEFHLHQEITIRSGLEDMRYIFNKLFHALGRYNEHLRPDRDRFVKIMRDNIKEGKP